GEPIPTFDYHCSISGENVRTPSLAAWHHQILACAAFFFCACSNEGRFSDQNGKDSRNADAVVKGDQNVASKNDKDIEEDSPTEKTRDYEEYLYPEEEPPADD